MKKVDRAGFLPYRIKDNYRIEFLFMKPSDPTFGGSHFQIAKGHVDPTDQSFLSAALRECEEELGVSPDQLENIKPVGIFHGRTHYFLGRLKKDYILKPFCSETGEIAFLDEGTFSLIGRELHRDVVKKAKELIVNSETLVF